MVNALSSSTSRLSSAHAKTTDAVSMPRYTKKQMDVMIARAERDGIAGLLAAPPLSALEKVFIGAGVAGLAVFAVVLWFLVFS